MLSQGEGCRKDVAWGVGGGEAANKSKIRQITNFRKVKPLGLVS